MSLDADSILDRRRLRRKLSFWRAAAFLALAVVVLALAVPSLRRAAPGSDQIARYTVSGLITNDREERETLDRIARADRVKAVILYIDSPGGTTTGAEALYGAIRRLDQLGGERDAVRWLAETRGIKADLPIRNWKKRRDSWRDIGFARSASGA